MLRILTNAVSGHRAVFLSVRGLRSAAKPSALCSSSAAGPSRRAGREEGLGSEISDQSATIPFGRRQCCCRPPLGVPPGPGAPGACLSAPFAPRPATDATRLLTKPASLPQAARAAPQPPPHPGPPPAQPQQPVSSSTPATERQQEHLAAARSSRQHAARPAARRPRRRGCCLPGGGGRGLGAAGGRAARGGSPAGRRPGPGTAAGGSGEGPGGAARQRPLCDARRPGRAAGVPGGRGGPAGSGGTACVPAAA